MALTEETRMPELAVAESDAPSSSKKTRKPPVDIRERLRLDRDARFANGERYSLLLFAMDLLVNHDVDMSNYQLRVDAVSRTEETTFKNDRAVGDAVIEVVHTWTDVPYSVIDLDPELLARTGLDQLRPRF